VLKPDELEALKNAELGLLARAAEAGELGLSTAEHQRLLTLVRDRMAGRLSREQFWERVEKPLDNASASW
jgi:hypothetical protein